MINEKELEEKGRAIFKMVGSKYAAPEIVARMSRQIIESSVEPLDDERLKKAQDGLIKGYVFIGQRDSLDFFARAIDKSYENRERQREDERMKTRTRAEWEALEYELIGYKPQFTDDSRPICAHWRCKQPAADKSKYCSVRCRELQKEANRNLRKYGTYMNKYEFKTIRSEYADKKHRIRFIPCEHSSLERLKHKLELDFKTKRPAPTSDSFEGHRMKAKFPHTHKDKERLSSEVEIWKMSPLLYEWYYAMAYGNKADVMRVEKKIEAYNGGKFTYKVEREEARCAVVSSL
jgi:hypothetical protein